MKPYTQNHMVSVVALPEEGGAVFVATSEDGDILGIQSIDGAPFLILQTSSDGNAFFIREIRALRTGVEFPLQEGQGRLRYIGSSGFSSRGFTHYFEIVRQKSGWPMPWTPKS